MSHGRSHHSPYRSHGRYWNHRRYHDNSRRGREWSEARRRRGNQERLSNQSNNINVLAGFLNQQQSDNVQHRTSGRSLVNNPVHYQDNSHSQSLFIPLENSSRCLSQGYFPSNSEESSYPRHQINRLCTTSERYTLNTRNTGTLSYVGRHLERSPMSQDLSPIMQQQNLTTRMSMTELPFLKVIATLLEVRIYPTACNSFKRLFLIFPEHILQDLKTNDCYKVLVRFCKNIAEPNQKDYFPSILQLKVNGIMFPLPGRNTIPMGPAAPVDITSKCDFYRTPNSIDVRSCEALVMFIQITRSLKHEDLLQSLLAKSPIPAAVTVSKIKDKLQEDMASSSDITMTSLHFALLCPLSKARMRLPCRPSTCEHLQCFDAACYLKMNEKKPKWVCPVCAGPVEYENLQIDEHFKNILEESVSADKILLQADGSWKPLLQQDLNKSVLTLDDTYDFSGSPVTAVSDVTKENIYNFQHTTIDLVSEDEDSSVVDFETVSTELGTTYFDGDDKDESFGNPACQILQQKISSTPQRISQQFQAASTPKTSSLDNTPKEGESTIPTPARAGRETSNDPSLNKSFGRPPVRMVLRSHTRMWKLANPHETLLSGLQ